MGVKHAVFSRKRGLKQEDMTPSPWIFDRLRRFRAGVEAGISWLKRCFGLGRCRWRGPAGRSKLETPQTRAESGEKRPSDARPPRTRMESVRED